jgi:glutathione synthase
MSDKSNNSITKHVVQGATALVAASLAWLGWRAMQQRLSAKENESKIAADALPPAVHLSPEAQIALAAEAEAWALTHGLVMGHSNIPGAMQHAPVTLLPSPFPKTAFSKVRNLTPDFNRLLDRVARDQAFLNDVLQDTAADDAFLRRLLDVYNRTRGDDCGSKFSLGIFRIDYMLDGKSLESKSGPQFLQVEMNTISAAFGCLSQRVSELHAYLNAVQLNGKLNADDMPKHQPLRQLPSALAAACTYHPASDGVVMMIVQPGERNSVDQRWLEYELWDASRIRMIRRTLADIEQRATLNARRDLEIDGHTIAVTYFRAGYTPDDYNSDREWQALERMERSRTIMCPSTAYHLAGTKKIQQTLSAPGVLEKFTDEATAKKMRRCFGMCTQRSLCVCVCVCVWKESIVLTFCYCLCFPCDLLVCTQSATQYSLMPSTELASTIEKAKAHPEDFVLKPQREGGGNNIWGNDIVEALDTFSPAKLSGFILMQKIHVC